MSLTGRPCEILSLQGACKRIAASKARTLFCQDDEPRLAMMRVYFKRDQPFLGQIIDDPLHVLPMRAEVSRQPRDWPRIIGGDNRAENLPARARQSERRDQPIPRRQKLVVQPEQVEDEVGHGVAAGRSFELGHFTP